LQKALKFMKDIAVAYQNNEVKRADLKGMRDKALQQLHGTSSRGSKAKRTMPQSAATAPEHKVSKVKRESQELPGGLVLERPSAFAVKVAEAAKKDKETNDNKDKGCSIVEGTSRGTNDGKDSEAEDVEENPEEEEPRERDEEEELEEPESEDADADGSTPKASPSAFPMAMIPGCIDDDLFVCMSAASLI
jgi:hypothetical protein